MPASHCEATLDDGQGAGRRGKLENGVSADCALGERPGGAFLGLRRARGSGHCYACMAMVGWELLFTERGEWFYIGCKKSPAGASFAREAMRARRLGLPYLELARKALDAGPAWLGWFCGFTGTPQERVEAGL